MKFEKKGSAGLKSFEFHTATRLPEVDFIQRSDG
jgi:hypothetical protein